MTISRQTRRDFLKHTGGAAAAAVTVPYFLSSSQARADDAASDRLGVGAIGVGGRGSGIGGDAGRRGNMVAVADVDRTHAERFASRFQGKPKIYKDYRELLDHKDIDIITIGTPDHWHTKIAIDAVKAGKDVYSEKPLTLTIEEGQLLCKAVKETNRVFQVGTQQRSDTRNFLTAIALAHSGRLGKIKKVQAAIGGGPAGGPFQKTDPPSHLDWDMWLGQCPMVDYIRERTHGSFRWWYEYSGGKMTDWGAHHVDIAQWAIQATDTGPLTVEPVSATHPVPFENGYPTKDDSYNTATAFMIRCTFAGGAEMFIRHDTENGITIEGEKGTIFVKRGRIDGEAVEDLKSNPLPEDAIEKLYKGMPRTGHMGNFFDCVKARKLPVSDVFSHHRILTTCHLANIAIRLDRTLKWDPDKEQIVGDDQAKAMQRREQRKGFEIVA